jgi:peptide/nickel transport system ATP-binding protein
MTAALEIRDLVKTYPVRNALGRVSGEVRAVDGVSFTIPAGGVYGLAGESGSGKSTIARMIMGLTAPDSGDILIDGVSILGQRERTLVQMVFQNPGASLNPRRTVAQSVMVPLVAHGFAGDRRGRIGDLLDMVHLPRIFEDRYPHELSGGQKQRVAIARALAVSPRLLVLDEPTSALDVSVQAQILNLLMDLKADFGLSMLFVTHNLKVVAHISDLLMVMHQGEVVESGRAESVIADPAQPYTRALMGFRPRP